MVDLDLTKQYVDIQDLYTFTEEWWDKNIREVNDLDSISKIKDIEYDLCVSPFYFLFS